jgi:tetratricopeptide (TPR) repeat protein
MSQPQLDTLESKGLIRLATVQPELEYLFRHALVQDTAYESLLKQERRALHRQVGDALEKLYPERRGDLAAVLAMHFEQAGETERAIGYLIEAGRFAHERNAIMEAFELFGRAHDLLPPPSVDETAEMRRARVEIALGRSRSAFGFLPRDRHEEIIDGAIAAAEELGDLHLAAEAHLYAALLRQLSGERPDRSPELRASLDRVEQIAEQLKDPLMAALPRSLIGLTQVFGGYLHEGVAALIETAPLLEQKRDFVGSSFALVALSIGYARLGEFAKAEQAADRAAELAASGDLIARLDSLIARANVRLVRGDLDGAVPLALQCTNLSEETGATACVIGSNLILGDAYMQQGRYQQARIAFERGNEVANVVQQHTFRPSITAYLRSSAASMGDFGPNARTFEEALAEARATGDRWNEANVLWKRAEAEGKRGAPADRPRMLADFEAALALFSMMGARPFTARVERDLGRALREAGRTAEADDLLRRSLDLLTELDLAREADELRAELPV